MIDSVLLRMQHADDLWAQLEAAAARDLGPQKAEELHSPFLPRLFVAEVALIEAASRFPDPLRVARISKQIGFTLVIALRHQKAATAGGSPPHQPPNRRVFSFGDTLLRTKRQQPSHGDALTGAVSPHAGAEKDVQNTQKKAICVSSPSFVAAKFLPKGIKTRTLVLSAVKAQLPTAPVAAIATTGMRCLLRRSLAAA
ncbi:hypothetical protein cyc_03785 [Cyclospora cayetanensis]|uniref:Uncharacterized protein n=1 Tax=Cyclospora cayetanensis TaxID=88456 RepID=A0A1D3D1L0_9EIME|nr:hypothetical protein cyc_03785 [Cyclospora cayetanensis]